MHMAIVGGHCLCTFTLAFLMGGTYNTAGQVAIIRTRPFTLAFLMGGTYNSTVMSSPPFNSAFTLAFLMGGTYNR